MEKSNKKDLLRGGKLCRMFAGLSNQLSVLTSSLCLKMIAFMMVVLQDGRFHCLATRPVRLPYSRYTQCLTLGIYI